jgi:hypothetical protein
MENALLPPHGCRGAFQVTSCGGKNMKRGRRKGDEILEEKEREKIKGKIKLKE